MMGMNSIILKWCFVFQAVAKALFRAHVEGQLKVILLAILIVLPSTYDFSPFHV